MTGWLILVLLVVAALGGLWLLGLRGAMLQLAAAALLFGSAGYAFQGDPDLYGVTGSARSSEPPIPMTGLRHAFFGQFTSGESWLRISEALASRGNTADAVGVLNAAVRQHPDDVMLWVGLGNALVDHSQVLTPASQFAYQRAAELAPGHPAPIFFMGLALARSGDRAGALALWNGVLAQAPADSGWRPIVEDAVAVISEPRP